MPDLPPVEERFTADTSQYLRALEEMAAMAERAAAAQERLVGGIEAMNRAMDEAARGAAEAAQAEDGLAGAADHAAGAAAGAAGALGAEAAAVRDLAAAWGEEELAQKAADAAAEAFGRDVARASDEFEAFMGDRLQASIQNLERDLYVIGHSAGEIDPVAQALGMMGDDLHRLGLSATASAGDVQRASDTVGRAMGVQVGWLRVGVANWATFLHWVVAGSAEFLAVAVPAAIALGAGVAVAAQGAQNAYEHMSALYNTMEAVGPAFGKTAGDVLGLGHSLQSAQDQANPGVYEMLGSVINDLKTRFADFAGTGLQVVHMLDEFSARVTTDLSSGGMGAELHGLLSGMVQDLQQFGQVLGNLGHALLNFAADMPGLAHVLLDIADGLSRVIEFASRGGVLITMAMGLEEMYRWGGLAGGVLVRLLGLTSQMASYGTGGFIFKFGSAMGALAQGAGAGIQALGSLIGKVGSAEGAFATLGAKVETFGFDMKVAAASASPLAIAASALIPGAMAILGVALDHARNASQRLIDSTNQAVQSAPTMTQAMQALATGAGKATIALQQQEGIFRSYPGYLQATGGATAGLVTDLEHISGPLGGVAQGMINVTSHTNFFTRAIGSAVNQLDPLTGAFHFFSSGAASAASQVDQLRAAVTQWANTGANMVHNAQSIASEFHLSLPAAFSAAQQAGVNLMQTMDKGSFALKVAYQQVRNLVTGLGAMGAPAGQIGTDMNALAIQSGLATSKVQQLNQALDQVFGMVSGGIQNFAQLDQAVRQMGNDSKSSSASLGGAFGSIRQGSGSAKSSVDQLHYSLRGIGSGAAQSLQQVTQSLQLAQQQADFFQQALSAGAIKVGGFDSAIKDIVGVMAPFAQGNKAVAASLDVIAQRAGGPVTTSIKTLAAWAGIHGPAAMKALESAVNQTSGRLSNLSAVAQHLGTTMQGQLNTAFSQAVLNALHYNGALQNLASALIKYPAHSQQVASAQARVNNLQREAATVTQKYSDITKQSASAAADNATKVAASASKIADQASKASQAEQAVKAHALSMQNAASAASDMSSKVNSLNSQVSTGTSTTQHLNSQVQQTSNMAHAATTAVDGLHTAVNNASGAASTAAGRMASLGSAVSRAGGQASAAAGQVQGLANAIAALQSKTITITTNMVTTTSHRAAGGPVAAGIPYIVGERGQELFVPSQNGTIVPAAATQQILSGSHGGQSSVPAGPINLTAEIHTHNHLDGKEVFKSIQTQSWQWQLRNRGAADGIWAPS